MSAASVAYRHLIYNIKWSAIALSQGNRVTTAYHQVSLAVNLSTIISVTSHLLHSPVGATLISAN